MASGSSVLISQNGKLVKDLIDAPKELVDQYFLKPFHLIDLGEISDQNEFFRLIDTQISPEIGEQIMNLATQLKEEGRVESRIEIAKRMLEEGSDPTFVVKVTGLSLEQIKELQKH